MWPTNWEIEKAEKNSQLRWTLGFGNKTFSSEETSSLCVVRRWGDCNLVPGKRGGTTGRGKHGGTFPSSHRPSRACYFWTTVEPPLTGHLWNGYPLLSGQLSKSQNNCTKEWEIKPLFSGRGHLLIFPTRVLPLFSPAAMKRLIHLTRWIFSSF